MAARSRTPDASARAVEGRSWTVRLARDEDIDAVAAIEQESFGDPWPREAFHPYTGRDVALFLVAEDTAGVAGYLVAFLVADEAELANIAVAASARGTGVGGALLDTFLQVAAERAIASVYLEVRVSNAPARRLYSSRGFEEVGVRQRYYRNPVENAIVLRRRLSQGPSPAPAN